MYSLTASTSSSLPSSRALSSDTLITLPRQSIFRGLPVGRNEVVARKLQSGNWATEIWQNEDGLLECGLKRSLCFAWHKTTTAANKCQSILGGERNMLVDIEIYLNRHIVTVTYIFAGHHMSPSQCSQPNTEEENNHSELLNKPAALTDKSSSEVTGLTWLLNIQQLFYSNSSTHRWGQLVISRLWNPARRRQEGQTSFTWIINDTQVEGHFSLSCSVVVLLCACMLF